MPDKNQILAIERIQSLIYTIRGFQVMLDSDLAEMYQVETKYLNRAVKRNAKRFPLHFMFQLTDEEFENLRFQFVTSKNKLMPDLQKGDSNARGGRRYLPYAFTEQGVSMLSAVLKSETAIQVSIRIMDAFVKMRTFLTTNAAVFQRIDRIEHKQIETDHKFEQVFEALEEKIAKPKQGIFFNGEIYDAYTFTSDIIREAQNSIILIDNYVDDYVLTLLSKRNKNVSAFIYTKEISKKLKLDLKKHNSQYPEIAAYEFKNAHDRFLIIDKKELYHFGASLKDLGKKWFAFSKMNSLTKEVLQKLKKEEGYE